MRDLGQSDTLLGAAASSPKSNLHDVALAAGLRHAHGQRTRRVVDKVGLPRRFQGVDIRDSELDSHGVESPVQPKAVTYIW